MDGEFDGVAPVKSLADFSELKEGQVIEATKGFEFEYEQTYNSDYQDSLIANTFTLGFDYCPSDGAEEATPSASPQIDPDNPDEPYECESGGGSAEAATISTVIIGEAPAAKDGCWPTVGYISQGPFGEFSHCSRTTEGGSCTPNTYDDAVDIANGSAPPPVCSPFNGKVVATKAANGNGSGYGNAVIIESGAGKFIFGHLSVISVSAGDSITPGTLLGKMGNTGFSTGQHLHYSRANSNTNPPRFYSYPGDASSVLMTLHQGSPEEEINSCCVFSN